MEAYMALGIVLAAAAGPEIFAEWSAFPGLWVHGEQGEADHGFVIRIDLDGFRGEVRGFAGPEPERRDPPDLHRSEHRRTALQQFHRIENTRFAAGCQFAGPRQVLRHRPLRNAVKHFDPRGPAAVVAKNQSDLSRFAACESGGQLPPDRQRPDTNDPHRIGHHKHQRRATQPRPPGHQRWLQRGHRGQQQPRQRQR